MRKIVFDIETQNTFADVGSNNPSDLDISVVTVYDYDTDTYTTVDIKDLSPLWPIIEKADMLIGFNSDHFDIPLLNKYSSKDLTQIKSLDILREIKNSYGRRMKLDQIAEGTLGVKKSGHGLQAIAWWNKGDIDKIKQYCEDDVRITKNLYDFVMKNKHLKFKEGGEVMQVNLDTSDWEKNTTENQSQSLF